MDDVEVVVVAVAVLVDPTGALVDGFRYSSNSSSVE